LRTPQAISNFEAKYQVIPDCSFLERGLFFYLKG